MGERSDTHHLIGKPLTGFAALNPSYNFIYWLT